MEGEILSDFDTPWCRKILQSPDYTVQPSGRAPPPPGNQVAPQKLFDLALRTPTTVRAWRRLTGRTVKPDMLSVEEVLLLSLGGDLCGHKDILHGGIFGVLVDQVSAMSAYQSVGAAIVTQEIKVRYIKSIRLPGVVVCRAAIAKREGQLITVKSTIHDNEDKLCCEGETIFWERRRKQPSL